MNFLRCRCSARWGDIAPTILRVATGIVFLAHGYQKFFIAPGGISETVSFFGTTIGIPAAGFFAPFVAGLELVGGAALIAGLLTHWAAKLLAIDMLVALVLVHAKAGFFLPYGVECALVLFAASLSLMITGPGKWSLDEKVFMKSDGTTRYM